MEEKRIAVERAKSNNTEKGRNKRQKSKVTVEKEKK